MFLSDYYCRKLGLMDLLGYNEKVTSDIEMICSSYQRHKSGNRDYSSHFLVTFETASKFVIVFVRLLFGKLGNDGFTGLRRKIGIRYEFDLKVILKRLGSE